MNFLEKFKIDKNFITILLFSAFNFLTWFFNVPELINITIHLVVLVVMACLKVSNSNLILYTIFSTTGNFEPTFLKWFDGIYETIFNVKIGALRNYHNFLYTMVFAVLILILLIRFIKYNYKINGKMFKPMLFIILYATFTLLWTPTVSTGMSEIWFIIQGYFIYVVMMSDDEEHNNYLKISWYLSSLLLVIALQTFVLNYQYFQKHNIDLNFFNYWRQSGKGQVVGLWANANLVAAVFGISFIPSLYKYFDKDQSKLKWLFIPFELLILYGMYLTKSKGLYISIFLSLLFVGILFVRKQKSMYITFISLVLTFVAFVVFAVSVENVLPSFYEKVNKLSTGRFALYKNAINHLKDPFIFVFGRGAGADRYFLEVEFYHSWFFQIMMTRGLVTLIAIFVRFYYMVETIFLSKVKFKYFVGLGIIAYLIHGITDSGFEYQYIAVISLMLIAMMEKNLPKDINTMVGDVNNENIYKEG